MHPARVRFVVIAFAALLSLLPAVAASPARNAGTATAHLAWTPQALYVAFQVDDPDIVGNQREMLRKPWLDDAVAVYLNFDPTRTDTLHDQCLRVVVSAAGGATVQRGGPGGWRDDAKWFDAQSRQGTIRFVMKLRGKSTINNSQKRDEGYQAEIGLAWHLLGIPAPAIGDGEPVMLGVAVVRYSQGESQAITCWPTALTAADLDQPGRWGMLRFTRETQIGAGTERSADAPLFPRDPFIDGEISEVEWGKGGLLRLSGPQATVTPPAPSPVKTGRQLMSVTAAWYLLDPFRAASLRRPLDPPGPWAGPESPLYHQFQLRGARQAGIDALAVVLPLAPQARAQTRSRLAALAGAARDFSGTLTGEAAMKTALLLPVIDLSGVEGLDLTRESGLQEVAALIEEFFALVPPQYRLMTADGGGRYCYPVVLTNPERTARWDTQFTARIAARLQSTGGAPVGWIIDNAWQETPDLPGVLSCCALSPPGGMELGRGPLLTAVLSAGDAGAHRVSAQARSEETFASRWQKVAHARPDLVLIRSWNDFAQGSEIAASNAFGYRYVDSTQQELLRLAQARGFGICVLNHTLPPVLQPGKRYPVEVLIKNGSLQQIAAATGCQLDYRIQHKGETVAAGMIDERLTLHEWSATRLRFTLATGKDTRRQALPDGDYLLHLDFGRNKVALLNSKLLREKLGTLTIPFTIARRTETAQAISGDFPRVLLPGMSGAASLDVRNTSKESWRKGGVSLRFRWADTHGAWLPGEVSTPCRDEVASGETTTIRSPLPAAPTPPGWYYLIVDMPGIEPAASPIYRALIQVAAVDLLAEFRTISFHRSIEGTTQGAEGLALLHNRGLTPWRKGDTQLTYQWLSWNGTPLRGASGSFALEDDVPADGVILHRFALTPPPGAGSYYCAFGVTHAGQSAPLITDPMKVLFPVISATVDAARFQWVNLSEAYHTQVWAAYGNDTRVRLDFDGTGRAFPLEEFLPDATYPPSGYQPGYHLGAPTPGTPGFHFGSFVAGAAPVVLANGEEIPLPDKPAVALHLVATCTRAPRPVDFLVRYADGTEQTIRLTVSHWLGEAQQHEPIMLTTRHLHTVNGDDPDQHGSLFVYRLALDPARTPAKLILPLAKEIAIFAATLELAP